MENKRIIEAVFDDNKIVKTSAANPQDKNIINAKQKLFTVLKNILIQYNSNNNHLPNDLVTQITNLITYVEKKETFANINKSLIEKFGFIKNIVIDDYFIKSLGATYLENVYQTIETAINDYKNEISKLKDGDIKNALLATIDNYARSIFSTKPTDVNAEHIKLVNGISSQIKTIVSQLEKNIYAIDGHIAKMNKYFNDRQYSRSSNLSQEKQYYTDFISKYRKQLMDLFDGYNTKLGEIQSKLVGQNIFSNNRTENDLIVEAAWFERTNQFEINKKQILDFYNNSMKSINSRIANMIKLLDQNKVSLNGETYNSLYSFIQSLNPNILLNETVAKQQQKQQFVSQENTEPPNVRKTKTREKNTSISNDPNQQIKQLIGYLQNEDRDKTIGQLLSEWGFSNRP